MARNKGAKALGQLFGICILGTAISAFANETMSDDAIKQRIKPVGRLYLKGSEATAPAVAAPAAPRTGESVYNTYCMACHATGVTGAPITGDAQQWQPRIAQGMDTLLAHALDGFNAMPAKGTCMDCSDDEIQAAIDHMLKGI